MLRCLWPRPGASWGSSAGSWQCDPRVLQRQAGVARHDIHEQDATACTGQSIGLDMQIASQASILHIYRDMSAGSSWNQTSFVLSPNSTQPILA